MKCNPDLFCSEMEPKFDHGWSAPRLSNKSLVNASLRCCRQRPSNADQNIRIQEGIIFNRRQRRYDNRGTSQIRIVGAQVLVSLDDGGGRRGVEKVDRATRLPI